IFWNTVGVKNKDKEFWKYIGKFEFVSLCETWLERVYARREKKRGRAKGGFIIGLRKEWIENSSLIYKEEEVVMSTIRVGEKGL
ncbi:hypothetical protein ALC57_18745, partial [Trachymyrmex cornetzi]